MTTRQAAEAAYLHLQDLIGSPLLSNDKLSLLHNMNWPKSASWLVLPTSKRVTTDRPATDN